MSRFASALNEAAAEEADIVMCLAADLDFPSGHVRVTDAIGEVVIGGNTFEGVGSIDFPEPFEESIDGVPRPVRMVLSAVDADMIAAARAGGYQLRQARIYFCLFNKETHRLVDEPEVEWRGQMDTINVSLGRGAASMSLSCESILRGSAQIALYTDQDQQLRYPGDRFFDLVPKIAGFVGQWGELTRLIRTGSKNQIGNEDGARDSEGRLG